jgi:hypothetical protein
MLQRSMERTVSGIEPTTPPAVEREIAGASA